MLVYVLMSKYLRANIEIRNENARRVLQSLKLIHHRHNRESSMSRAKTYHKNVNNGYPK